MPSWAISGPSRFKPKYIEYTDTFAYFSGPVIALVRDLLDSNPVVYALATAPAGVVLADFAIDSGIIYGISEHGEVYTAPCPLPDRGVTLLELTPSGQNAKPTIATAIVVNGVVYYGTYEDNVQEIVPFGDVFLVKSIDGPPRVYTQLSDSSDPVRVTNRASKPLSGLPCDHLCGLGTNFCAVTRGNIIAIIDTTTGATAATAACSAEISCLDAYHHTIYGATVTGQVFTYVFDPSTSTVTLSHAAQPPVDHHSHYPEFVTATHVGAVYVTTDGAIVRVRGATIEWLLLGHVGPCSAVRTRIVGPAVATVGHDQQLLNWGFDSRNCPIFIGRGLMHGSALLAAASAGSRLVVAGDEPQIRILETTQAVELAASRVMGLPLPATPATAVFAAGAALDVTTYPVNNTDDYTYRAQRQRTPKTSGEEYDTRLFSNTVYCNAPANPPHAPSPQDLGLPLLPNHTVNSLPLLLSTTCQPGPMPVHASAVAAAAVAAGHVVAAAGPAARGSETGVRVFRVAQDGTATLVGVFGMVRGLFGGSGLAVGAKTVDGGAQVMHVGAAGHVTTVFIGDDGSTSETTYNLPRLSLATTSGDGAAALDIEGRLWLMNNCCMAQKIESPCKITAMHMTTTQLLVAGTGGVFSHDRQNGQWNTVCKLPEGVTVHTLQADGDGVIVTFSHTVLRLGPTYPAPAPCTVPLPMPLPILPEDINESLEALEDVHVDCETAFTATITSRGLSPRPRPHTLAHIEWCDQVMSLPLPTFMTGLHTSRPFMLYWLLHAQAVCGHTAPSAPALRALAPYRHHGGLFASHALVSYGAVLAACEAVAMDHNASAQTFYSLLSQAPNAIEQYLAPDGGCRAEPSGGEHDVRVTYGAVVAALAVGALPAAHAQALAGFAAACQGSDGGFGALPGAESHSGYTFAALALLVLLKRYFDVDVSVDLDSAMAWVLSRQTLEGGFCGRPEKLVDGCYGFWCSAAHRNICELQLRTHSCVGALLPTPHPTALQAYLHGASECSAGCRDKPGMAPDPYHTCYVISGMALAAQLPGSTETGLESMDAATGLTVSAHRVFELAVSRFYGFPTEMEVF